MEMGAVADLYVLLQLLFAILTIPLLQWLGNKEVNDMVRLQYV